MPHASKRFGCGVKASWAVNSLLQKRIGGHCKKYLMIYNHSKVGQIAEKVIDHE